MATLGKRLNKMGRRVRRKLETVIDSPRVTKPVADWMARRIRRWDDGIDWTLVGQEDLIAELERGQPVIMALWHGRLGMAATAWDADWGGLCVVTSTQRPGRMVGRVMTRFGHSTLPMSSKKKNTGTSLQVARMARDGMSMGFAVDGPSGPKRIAKSVPVDWARLTGCPIWLFTYSLENHRCVGTWDRMALPKGKGRGCMLYRRWDAEVPKRLDDATREALRQKLEDDLNELTLEADRMMGHPGLIN